MNRYTRSFIGFMEMNKEGEWAKFADLPKILYSVMYVETLIRIQNKSRKQIWALEGKRNILFSLLVTSFLYNLKQSFF